MCSGEKISLIVWEQKKLLRWIYPYALSSNREAKSVVELSLNPLFKRKYHSIYRAINSVTKPQKESKDNEDKEENKDQYKDQYKDRVVVTRVRSNISYIIIPLLYYKLL